MAAFAQAALKLVARLDVLIESHSGDVRIAASGAKFSGVTDAQGMTRRFALSQPYEAYTVEFPPEETA